MSERTAMTTEDPTFNDGMDDPTPEEVLSTAAASNYRLSVSIPGQCGSTISLSAEFPHLPSLDHKAVLWIRWALREVLKAGVGV